MDTERFGALLQRFRKQTSDPRTKGGGPLTENRLANLVKDQTRLEISGTQIEIWETGRDQTGEGFVSASS